MYKKSKNEKIKEFEEYWKDGHRDGKLAPAMPKEKWNTIEEYLIYLRFLSAYIFAERFVDNKSVLEIGFGAGYGANYLSRSALSYVGIDSWKEEVLYCQSKYGKNNMIFIQGDGVNLPSKNNSFDVVISLQVIEHIGPNRVFDYLSEIKRVLKDKGIFILSTPNRELRLLPFQKPWNPYHKKEYNYTQLHKTLNKVFKNTKIYGLYGREEIQFIECARVKQSPYIVYLQRPFHRLMKYLIPWLVIPQLRVIENFLIPRTREKNLQSKPTKYLLERFSVNDFTVDPTRSKKSLDLIGVCTN